MPCRANRCHRAAVRVLQTSPTHAQHIWISDDLLAQAFSRFTLAVNSTGSKRHGSNVPGPLEARKRAARRRMVGLAQHQASPMPDFGSLFGTGSALGAGVDVGGLWKPPRSDQSNPLQLCEFMASTCFLILRTTNCSLCLQRASSSSKPVFPRFLQPRNYRLHPHYLPQTTRRLR